MRAPSEPGEPPRRFGLAGRQLGCAARGPRAWGVALLLASAPACATTSATDEELARLRRDVHALRGELAEANTAIQTLEGKVTLLAASSGAGARSPTASAPEPELAAPVAGRPSLPVVRLEGSGTEPRPVAAGKPKKGRSRDPDSGALDDGSPPILIKVGPSDTGEKLTVDKDVLDKPDPVLGTKGVKATEKREKADYDAALAALRAEAKPAHARTLFLAFQARYPRSELNDNAAYWLGECSFAEGQYARSIEELAKLVSERPSAPKVPDALLLTAEAWLKLGKSREAEDVLRRLIKTHPNSAARAAADKRLAEIGAT